MLTVGLTGGIGCGKSAVAERLHAHGVPVIDADLITRGLVVSGAPALAEITQRFGLQVLQPDGTLDRQRLRAIIFTDARARQALEAILHPKVHAEIKRHLAQVTAPYAVVVIPLLVESNMTGLVDRVLVVDCDEDIQIMRVMARDHCTRDEVQAIIATQASRRARSAAATDVLENSGDLAILDQQIKRLHQRYLALAAAGLS